MQVHGVSSLVLCLFCLLHTAAAFRRVCYFTNWSRDLQQAGARFRLTDVEPFLCTHLVYAFAAVQPSNSSLAPIVTLLAEGQQEELQRYRDFNALKKVNAELRTMLSVGGSIQANKDFVQVVSSDSGRKRFAANSVMYLRTYGFDGLDIDWEYPGDQPDTKLNFTQLLRELRSSFNVDAESRGKAPLLLSVAAPVSEAQMRDGYDVPQVSSLVDFVNLMAYDFHGSWNSITSFNSPLYARAEDPRFSPELSVNWAVQAWLQKGAEAQKLVLGIAGYGQSFTLKDPSKHGVGAPTNGSGKEGRWRRMEGQLSYYEICEYITNGGTEVWDDLQRVPYVYLGDQWVGYDNPDSINDKVNFALQHSLGGVMLWALDMDDFRGAFCGKGRYPLLSAMVSAIGDKMPDVRVRLTDTVTWPHPDNVTTPAPTSPSTTTTTTTTAKQLPTSSTTKSTRSTSTTSTKSLSTTTSTVSPTTTFKKPASTQQVVVISKKNTSSAVLHLSCRLLLTLAFLVLHVLTL
ncbi:chitinase-3-like protein 1 [Littorina saxatilis]|uniref:GH18 domain-containing protein n=1 Tax=Littorina saxatilis TaxID=31220 RepID=A0AAN9BWN1_9CAEN